MEDFKLLVKFRLSMMVVITSLLAYAIAASGQVHLVPFILLGLGGFMVTAAANVLNEVLEREYDVIMARTANRPLATGRMQVSEAVAIAGFLCLGGIIILSMFNPLTGLLGMLSLVIYAFIYTPLKRYHPVAVAVGAIPGALPALIGAVAFENGFTPVALMLFGIQFLWQFPHFWAIAVLAYEDYKKAGFKIVPEVDGAVNPQIGLHCLIYTVLLIPVCIGGYLMDAIGLVTLAAAILCSLFFCSYAWTFSRTPDKVNARKLMFSSFAYLPLVFILIFLGNMLT